MSMYDELYWETGVSGRKPYRRFFRGWDRVYQNAAWWANSRRNVYISVYGCKQLRKDGLYYGFKRDILPDYRTAVVDKIFLDIDYHDSILSHEEFREVVAAIETWLDSQDYRRRWIFSGGGLHCLIKAAGEPKSVDNAIFYIITNVAKGKMVDEGAFDIERMRRFPNSFNKKRGTYCINVSTEEISLPWQRLLRLASSPRQGTFPRGRETWFIDDMPNDYRPYKAFALGSYQKITIDAEKHEVLGEYGLDWDYDFCNAMQNIINKEKPNNFDRLQLYRYLRSVLKVPFVDAVDETKTVMNLVYNLLENKAKARHSISMAEAESVYKRGRVFHPMKLRKLGYCPENCSKCLDRRQENA